MVDLVKIRKKAREKKSRGASDEGSDQSAGRAVAKARKAGRTRPRSKAGKKPERGSRSARKEPKSSKPNPEPIVADLAPELEDSPADIEVGTGRIQASPETKRSPEPASSPGEKRGAEDGVSAAVVPERLREFRETVGTAEAVVGEDVSSDDGESNHVELLTFVVAGEQYAVEIENIVEIITPRSATRVPNSPTTTLGIFSLRGTIVTLLDVRRILGHPALAALPVDARIVVIQYGEETAGFVVDRVSRVIKIAPDELESHPVISAAEQSEFVRGVFRHKEELMILLDLRRLLA